MESTTTISSIRAILQTFDRSLTLVDVTRPEQGIVNNVFFLGTLRTDFVLKTFDDDSGLWKPQKEAAMYSRMRALDIPAPVVLVVDASRTVAPFTYSLSARVEGRAWSDVHASLDDDQNTHHYGQLGFYLSRLHANTFAQFGDVHCRNGDLVVGSAYEPGEARGPFTTWRLMHREIVNSRLRLIHGTAFEDLAPWIEDYFARTDGLIDFEVAPRLLHMDLHRGNILIENDRISGILDVEESIVGHNEYDLMRTELANFRGQPPGYERAFMDAYTQHIALDEGYLARKNFYDASRTLAWIRSLVLHGERYSKGQPAQSSHAARAHLMALMGGGQS